MQNRVPDYAEPEMSGLNDARMHGADSDFCDALALNLQEVVLALRPWHVVHPINHRVDTVGPVLVENQWPQIGVPHDLDPVLVVEFSLMPCCRGHLERDGAKRPVSRQHDLAVIGISHIKNVVSSLLAVRTEASENSDKTCRPALFGVRNREHRSRRYPLVIWNGRWLVSRHRSTAVASRKRTPKRWGMCAPKNRRQRAAIPIAVYSDGISLEFSTRRSGSPPSMLKRW